MEQTGENHWPVASHWQTLSHIVASCTLHQNCCWNMWGRDMLLSRHCLVFVFFFYLEYIVHLFFLISFNKLLKSLQYRSTLSLSCGAIYNKSTWMVWFVVFNTTFKNISVILWQSVLLVEETVVPGENHWQTISHNVVSSTLHHEWGSNSQL